MSPISRLLIHSSQHPDAVAKDLLKSLRLRQVNHKFHYDSIKQTQKWLTLHQAYSPSRTDPDCAAMYDAGFERVAEELKTPRVSVIGLGCGGGQKDYRLLRSLRSRGAELYYAPCDVSTAMVLIAEQTAQSVVPESECQPFVFDLASCADLPELFEKILPHWPRIITFFGMIPNFEPDIILPRLRDLVRTEDTLLFSANLAPGNHYRDGVEKVLPLYDNALTKDWLITFLTDLGIERGDGSVIFQIEETPRNLLRIVADFVFARDRTVQVGDEKFSFCACDSIRLFFSYRYTAALISQLLRNAGLSVLDQWITPSEEEGVFLCRRLF